MDEQDFRKIDEMIARHIGIFAESINHKIDIVAEGPQMLSEKIDRMKNDMERRFECVEHKLDTTAAKLDAVDVRLSKKIDDIAADLKAHRADTEAHRELYRVKEPE